MFQKLFTSLILSLIAIMGLFLEVKIGEFVSFYTPESYAAQSCGTSGADPATCIPTGGLENPANQANNQAKTSTEVTKLYNSLVALINLLLAAITVIVSPAIMLAGWLMSPDWTSGDLFGLRGVMYKLWITISNITYFIYAILLIFIALATIFGRENYGYKAMLPKLALGILMVPFTWWFVQWTISLSSIVTASVINIPEEALQSIIQGKNGFWNEKIIPEKVIFDENSKEKTVKCSDDKSKCMTPQDMLSKSSGMYGHMLIYAYGIFKLNEVKEIDTVSDALSAVVKIIHDSFIAVIMLVVFGLLTLALIFMLLARAVMLWIYTIFSPFLTLELVMGGLMKKVSDDFSIKEFIGLAFMPAIVGLALSFGLVVVAAVQSPIPKVVTEDTKCTVPKLTGAGCELARIMGNDANKITRKLEKSTDGKYYTTINIVEIGGMTLEFKGKPTGYTDVNPETQANDVNSTVNIISSAGGTFGTIVIDIIALLFIWMAFMAAKGVSKVVNAAAQPFEDMGKKIGSLGASLPKYMPLPVPGGLSASGLGKVAAMPEQFLSQKSAEKTKGIEEQMGKAFGVNLPYGSSDKAIVRSKVNGNGGLDGSNHEEIRNQAKAIGAKIGDITTANGQEYARDIHAILKNTDDAILGKYNLSKAEIEKLDPAQAVAQFIAGTSKKIGSPNEAKEYFKNLKEGKVTGDGKTISIARIADTNEINLTIEGKLITVQNKKGENGVAISEKEKADLTTAITGKTGIISKDEFILKMASSGTMSKAAAEDLAQKINSINNKFFSEEKK